MVATVDPREKMVSFREFTLHPVAPQLVEFSRLLSCRLGSRTDPLHFVKTTGLLLDDLSRGLSGFAKDHAESIKSPLLVGKNEQFYNELRYGSIRIAQVAFPQDFSESVRQWYIDQAKKRHPDVHESVFDTPEDIGYRPDPLKCHNSNCCKREHI